MVSWREGAVECDLAQKHLISLPTPLAAPTPHLSATSIQQNETTASGPLALTQVSRPSKKLCLCA